MNVAVVGCIEIIKLWRSCWSNIYIYIHTHIYLFKSVRINITSSMRWMLTIRFIYFDSKCMHLSKLLHNQWSTCIGTNVVTSLHTDQNETDIYIYIYIYTVFLLSVRPDNKYIRTKNMDHRLWRSFDKRIHFESKYVNLVVHILRHDIFIVRTN